LPAVDQEKVRFDLGMSTRPKIVIGGGIETTQQHTVGAQGRSNALHESQGLCLGEIMQGLARDDDTEASGLFGPGIANSSALDDC
jgi:hypothetical protein